MARMRPRHGRMKHRGMTEDAVLNGQIRSNRFFTQFPELDHYSRDDEFFAALGRRGGPMQDNDEAVGDADIPAGFGILGQFIDHDVTLDTTSSFDREHDPEALENFRTPRLDLDSLYGSGPEATPFLYDDRDSAKLLLGEHDSDTGPEDASEPAAVRFDAYDLLRVQKERVVKDSINDEEPAALIGDPRNDENDIVAQLHLTFAKLHNRVVDYLRSGDGRDLWEGKPEPDDEDALLHEAQRIVRWHYQWIVLNEFLPSVCDNSVIDDIKARGRQYFFVRNDGDATPAIPVEFAVAAYRYGHSQIRNEYRVNEDSDLLRFFPDRGEDPSSQQTLSDFGRVDRDSVIDWSFFFDFQSDEDGSPEEPQRARKIDPQLPASLLDLPFVEQGTRSSLATRNLQRGKALGLPSGQDVAERMNIAPISNEDLPLTEDTMFHDYLREEHRGGDKYAPLWLYVLAEAKTQQDGNRLGALGSRIVAEVLQGLVQLDDSSYLNTDEAWHPELPRPISGTDKNGSPTKDEARQVYRIADLLNFATGLTPDGLLIEAVDYDGTGPAPATQNDPTGGEAIILHHKGEGELSLEGYQIDFDDDQIEVFGEVTMEPGERLVVYTGEEEPDPEDYDAVVALGRASSVINNDEQDTIVIRASTDEVSAYWTGGNG